MKRILLALMPLVTLCAFGQNATVTATVPAYANGTAVSTFINGGGGSPTITVKQAAINNSGFFRFNLVQNAAPQYTPSTYSVQICATVIQPMCYTATGIVVSGLSQDISAAFAAAPQFAALQGYGTNGNGFAPVILGNGLSLNGNVLSAPGGNGNGPSIGTGAAAVAALGLSLDLIPAGFNINNFGGGSLQEIGATVTNPFFTAAYSTTPTSAQITNTDNIGSPLTLTNPFTSGTVTGAFTHTTASTTLFTLTAVGSSTKTATQNIVWAPRTFSGAGTAGATGATASGTNAVLTGATGTLAGPNLNNQGSYTCTASGNYCYVLMIGGSHTFTSSGFGVPMNTPTAVNVTNANGSVVQMYLYQTTNALSGAFTLVVASFMLYPFPRRKGKAGMLASLGLFASVASAQVNVLGHIKLPSTTDSPLGQATVVLTSDGNCNVATATGCTVSNDPYVDTQNVTCNVTLTAARLYTVIASPGRTYHISNGCTQTLNAGASGATVPIAAGANVAIWSPDGVNFVTGAGSTSSPTTYNTPQSGVPTGTIDGSNTAFTLSSTPVAGTVVFAVNGIARTGSLSGAVYTVARAPQPGDTLYAYWSTAGSSTTATTPLSESLAGTINGTNAAFTLSHTPVSGSLQLQKNGLFQSPAIPSYAISGTTITFASGHIPQTGDSLNATYAY